MSFAFLVFTFGGGDCLHCDSLVVRCRRTCIWASPVTRIRLLTYPGFRTTNAGVAVVTAKRPSLSVRTSSGEGPTNRLTTTSCLPV